MPFASGATLVIENMSSVDIETLTYTIEYSPDALPGLGEDAGYFHATTNSETPTTSGEDYNLIEIDGAGHIVASVLFMQSLPDPPFGLERAHLEGDERIYIDNSSSPALYGTGTEDYLNGGFYFSGGFFSLPKHGAPVHFDGAGIDETGGYRLHLTDPIVFRTRVAFGLEHGSPAGFEAFNWNGNYHSVVLWYGLAQQRYALSDVLDVGNIGSELAHSYSAQQSSGVLAGDHFYEGDEDWVSVSDDGRTAGGQVQFEIGIDPENNGVVLRRRSDQAILNQRAEVFVDGVSVATWYDPGRNTSKRWLDSEVILPASATAGKSSLTITLVPEGGVPWSAYQYWAFSIVTSAPKGAQGDTDGDTVANDVDLDDDGDGCSDTKELGSDPGLGGQRDPHNFWDFYDVWTHPPGQPLAWERNGLVNIFDVFGVGMRFGPGPELSEAEAFLAALTPPSDATSYHAGFDRGPIVGLNAWNRAGADGSINIPDDLLGVAFQFGHSCE